MAYIDPVVLLFDDGGRQLARFHLSSLGAPYI